MKKHMPHADDRDTAALIQPLIDEEIAQFDRYNAIPHEFSGSFYARLENLLRRDRLRSKIRTCARRAAVGILAAALISCAAIKPIREKITEAFMTWYDECIGIVFKTDDVVPVKKNLTYIPQGYELISHDELDGFRDVLYMDESGRSIFFSSILLSYEAEIKYDYEHYTLEEIHIHGEEAILFVGERGDYMLTWKSEGYVYSLGGDISREEILRIAESVQ